MTQIIEEANLVLLPKEDQISDDFLLYSHEGLYYAIRTRGKESVSFCLEGKSRWEVISKAVGAIEQYVLTKDSPTFVPAEFERQYDSNS